MRKLIRGLLGLCLLAALVPVEASARADARASAQSSPSRSASSRQAVARPASHSARSTTSTRSSTRPSAARSGDRGRATASRSAGASRHATAERSGRRNEMASTSRSRGRETAASHGRGRDSYVSARGSRSLNSRMAVAVPYGRSYAMPQGRSLRRTAMSSCTTRHGRRTCTTTASRGELMRWTGGLAPAAMSQSSCPDGTIATLAIGHNDITRCVPL